MNEQTRSRDYLKEHGYAVDTVERWLTFPARTKDGKPEFDKHGAPKMIRNRQDCYGFADLIACSDNFTGVLFVQTTSYANMFARIKKSLAIPTVKVLLKSRNRVHIHGWRKVPEGKRERWRLRVVELYLDDFGDVEQRVLMDEAKAEQEPLLPATETLFDMNF